MEFDVDGLTVFFPFTHIYPEQYSYMVHLKRALDAPGPALIQCPSGTGKTVTLLSFCLSYQLQRPDCGKLIYCSRTVPEIEKVLEELKVVLKHRDERLRQLNKNVPDMLALGLSSRRNLCIEPAVAELGDGTRVDAGCRALTASWVREDASAAHCGYFEGYESEGKEASPTGVFTLDELRGWGREHGWCPYFMARHLITLAQVVVFSTVYSRLTHLSQYQYMLDPKISQLVTREFKGNSVVIFDEAHNIDTVCIDALSLRLDRRALRRAARNVQQLTAKLSKAKEKEGDRLRDEYNRLVKGLEDRGVISVADHIRAPPVLSDDVIQEVVPGNIRRGEHFLSLLRRVVEFVRLRVENQAGSMATEQPLVFVEAVFKQLMIEPRVLRFCSRRLGVLIRTLKITDVQNYQPLALVADFATMVATYSKGFVLLIGKRPDARPGAPNSEPALQLCCLDASLAMQPVFRTFPRVIITSGTLSPLELYPRILNFRPVVSVGLQMTLVRPCLCPMVVTRGSDQVPVSSKYEERDNPQCVRNYGQLMVELCKAVPDGIVCFFTSYEYLELTVSRWNQMNILADIVKSKLLFFETPDHTETALALENYRAACDSGRGAVLMSVARGKVSEGIDFEGHYGRAVVLIGIPFVYTQSPELRARLEYLHDEYQVRDKEFLTFDAMRHASQCVGRVIRGKHDYGIMVFADRRYNRSDKRGKLPEWIGKSLAVQNLNLSTDLAVATSRRFLREMAQPLDHREELGRALWNEQMVRDHAAELRGDVGGGDDGGVGGGGQ